MTRAVWFVVVLSAGVAAGGSASESRGALVSETRGRYLVEQVGMCQDCHSPRDERGAFLEDRWLGGATVEFTPNSPMPWSALAPPIAGLPTMSHEQAVRFLVTGQKPDGTRARPPMPAYRFNQADAEAVVIYLEALSTGE